MSAKLRLGIMMFLQYAIWGAWSPVLSVYLINDLGFSGVQADFIYALLAGYEDAPDDVELADGMSYNPFFAGAQIAMPPPLFDELVEFADGTPATVDQMARDVTVFLAWAASPELEQRKRIGIGVLIFLIVFTGLLYAYKRKIWADVH